MTRHNLTSPEKTFLNVLMKNLIDMLGKKNYHHTLSTESVEKEPTSDI